MSSLGRVVRAGVTRRRLQTAVTITTVLVAVACSVLAAGLLVASSAPFDHAFAEQRGAQLSAQFDSSRVTAAQLAATARTPGVTAAAGPYRTATVDLTATGVGPPAGIALPSLTIVGRAAGGPVDRLTLVRGHWPTKADQIVLSNTADLPPDVQQLRLPGGTTLTVVGAARSVSETADGWVTPSTLATLVRNGAPAGYQMLYRFAHAGSNSALSADRAAIAAAVPRGALTGTASYLAIKQVQDANTAAFVPFVAAFGVLGLVLSVLIIGIVVSGAVGASTRRIGILKALGCTPAQVVRAYLGQALIPAVIGTVLGVVAGNLLAAPVLHDAENSYDTVELFIPLWVNLAVPAVLLVAVAAAASVPALRAGRLRSVEAISVGRSPHDERGRLAHRLAARLPLRSIGLGLASPFARPARSAATAAAIVLGTATVTFGFGLALSLNHVQGGRELDSAGAVVVDTGAPGAQVTHAVPAPVNGKRPVSADPDRVAAAIAAQPGTRRFYGARAAMLTVSGISGATTVIGYQGDSSWATHQMVSGRWLSGPAQAVVTGRFLTAAGVHVGDRLTLVAAGRTTSVRIVGEVFALSDQGMDLLTQSSTLAALGLDGRPTDFNVELRPGTNVNAYVDKLNAAFAGTSAGAGPNTARDSDVIAAMDTLIGTLTVMLVVVAGLGVLNTVALQTRDRTHELGVYKALGMTPRQTVAMVLSSVVGLGLIAAAIGVPVGVAMHHGVLPMMAATTGEHIAGVDVAVYQLPAVVLLVIGGVIIAVAGALLPAGWAARTRAAAALRSE